jgi:L-rhamnose mutarotase
MPETVHTKVQRVGMVIGLRDEAVEEYRRLHADDEPGVRDLLRKHHITNFSIFLHRLPDGRLYEFAYYEYRGTDLHADLAALDAEPRNRAWLARCDPLQVPLPGEASWSVMESVYWNE